MSRCWARGRCCPGPRAQRRPATATAAPGGARTPSCTALVHTADTSRENCGARTRRGPHVGQALLAGEVQVARQRLVIGRGQHVPPALVVGQSRARPCRGARPRRRSGPARRRAPSSRRACRLPGRPIAGRSRGCPGGGRRRCARPTARASGPGGCATLQEGALHRPARRAGRQRQQRAQRQQQAPAAGRGGNAARPRRHSAAVAEQAGQGKPAGRSG